jgi:rod shape-determining protein MreD
VINVVTRNIIRFLFLIFFQVLILDNIRIAGYVNPYLYVLFILMLPFETPKWLLLISAFFLGFFVDMFSGTGGIHAAACVFMAFIRPNILKMVSARQDYEPGTQPIIRDLGFRWFFSYSMVMVSMHHFILFYIEAFSFNEFFQTFFRTVLSIIFTLFLLILSQYIMYRQKK